MGGFGVVHWLIIGAVSALIFGDRIEKAWLSLSRKYWNLLREASLLYYYRGPTMTERFKKFLWTWKFWAVLGMVGCVSGLYFQRVAANGSGLWCLGLIFLGAAYLEQQE